MDAQWEILLLHLLEFRYIYPSERNEIPNNILRELMERLKNQMSLIAPEEKVCRGLLLGNPNYEVAMEKWGYLNSNERP